MSTIFGLILKDLFLFKSYKKNFIFSIITFIIIVILSSFQRNMITTGTLLFFFIFGMNSISTFSYDEASDSDRFLLSMPITRKEIVLAKYLLAFINSFVALIFGFIICFISMIIIEGSIHNFSTSITYILIGFTSGTFLICADIPCIYKWGVEKGRMQATLVPVIILLFLSAILLVLILIFPKIFNISLLNILFNNFIFVCIIINLFMYFISFKISYKIFKAKDL